YVSIRRENRNIGGLLRETADSESFQRELVFWGITENLVFNPLTPAGEPIGTLSGTEISKEPEPLLRPTIAVLTFLPLIASGSIIVGDTTSLFRMALFREDTRPLYTAFSHEEWLSWTVQTIIAVTMTVLTGRLCYKISQFERATRT